MRKELLLFIGYLIIIFLGVILVDRISGYFLDKMLTKIDNKVEIGAMDFALNKVEDDLLIVGSSRAQHHYVTSIIKDSLDINAYNIGKNGTSISYQCCLINRILERYTPKYIIWEVNFNCLFFSNKDAVDFIYPYYDKDIFIRDVIDKKEGKKSELLMLFKMLRYNTNSIRIIMRYLMSSNESSKDDLLGYIPITPKTHKIPLVLEKASDNYENDNIDSFRVEIFKCIINKTINNGVKLIIVDSPQYSIIDTTFNNKSFDIIKNICLNNNILFLDNRQLPQFLDNPQWYRDVDHLNSDGAENYTRIFLKQLNRKLI